MLTIPKQDSTRNGESSKRTARKLYHRRISQYDEHSTVKRIDFTLAGSGKQIPEFCSMDSLRPQKQIEPFKIRDFIPHINSSIKGELSRMNKNSFLDFLLVQKAGKAGDQQFFDKLIQDYQFDPFKKTLKYSNEPKKIIQYLSKREERDEQINHQVKHFYKCLHHKRSGTLNDQPLDQMIIEKNNYLIQKLPRFKAKLEALQEK